MALAKAVPVITNCEVVIDDTRATVVPQAAAVALAGVIIHAPGALASVALKLTVQVAVAEAPIVIRPDWLVPLTVPLEPVPQLPLPIVVAP